MPAKHYRGYYEGFANSALWPALHSRPDLIQVTADEYASYREVNAFMARALLRFASGRFWVQDYHFLTLGAELRRLKIDHPVGFFLHTPWAERSTMAAVPHHSDLASAMLAYDLIGFQTDDDRRNFEDYLQFEFDLTVVDGVVTSEYGVTRLATFPIGIDVEEFATRATKSITRPEVLRLRASLQGAKFALGVDRLDYSKGLANRMRAFDRMFELEPFLKRAVSLLQVASASLPRKHPGLSRSEVRTRRAGSAKSTAVTARSTGVRSGTLTRASTNRRSPGSIASRMSVWLRRSGMNLVAKEYVAAQNPFDPGVLVLSSFAGAARELDAALLVNPHDIDGMARQIAKALVMGLEERRERWQSMVGKLRKSPLQNWFSDFLTALTGVHHAPAPLLVQSPATVPSTLDLTGSSRAAQSY